MVVSFDCISLIAKRASLEKCEKGLTQKLIDKYNLSKKHYDKYLIALPGAMSPYAMEEVVNEYIEKYKLKFLDEKKSAVDFVVIDAFVGPTTRCDWLQPCKRGYYEFEGEKISSIWVYAYKKQSAKKALRKRPSHIVECRFLV